MPRKYKTYKKYNKFQKKSYKRKSSRYRNRQQLLSISTVKAIAKKACRELPETKLKVFRQYWDESADHSNMKINGPTSAHCLNLCLLDNSDLTVGTGEGQRISNEIFFKGVKLNMSIRAPTIINTSMTATYGGMSTYVEVHIRIVKIKNCGLGGNAQTPELATEIAKSLYVNQRDLEKLSAKQNNYKSIYHKVIKFNPQQIQVDVASANQAVKPITRIIKKYIPINKKITYTSAVTDGDWKNNYFLWVYAYNVNQGTSATNFWGDLENYSPRIQFAYTTYYTDS